MKLRHASRVVISILAALSASQALAGFPGTEVFVPSVGRGGGEAWIGLPEWFEALNRDFRYQLTAIGAPSPNLYVAEEVSGNRFKIAGGEPGAKVSWQLTGIRHDAWAEAHRIPVEEDKPELERGTYLHPELFGQTPELGVNFEEKPGPQR